MGRHNAPEPTPSAVSTQPAKSTRPAGRPRPSVSRAPVLVPILTCAGYLLVTAVVPALAVVAGLLYVGVTGFEWITTPDRFSGGVQALLSVTLAVVLATLSVLGHLLLDLIADIFKLDR